MLLLFVAVLEAQVAQVSPWAGPEVVRPWGSGACAPRRFRAATCTPTMRRGRVCAPGQVHPAVLAAIRQSRLPGVCSARLL